MNKRDLVLNLLDSDRKQSYIPSGFFLHFDPAFHRGNAAVEKHLEYFRYTEMDFVKIQYEHRFPQIPDLVEPSDWEKLPKLEEDFFSEPLEVVKGLVKAAKPEALVLVTLYSPFMVAGQVNGSETITRHILDNPEKAKLGIEKVAEAMLKFVRACIRLGVDGFYASSQGAETNRFSTLDPFIECIKPSDLMVMEEINQNCPFNILHICDYHAGYADLEVFKDYPGDVVNCSLHLDSRKLNGREIEKMFSRPFMGGLDRKGFISSGNPAEIEEKITMLLGDIPERYILAADCTVPSDTPWENLRSANRAAHNYAR